MFTCFGSGWFKQKTTGFAKIIGIHVVFLSAMMNELLKIQQDMGTPQQQQRHDKAAFRDENEPDVLADPNDWVADLPKFGIYHHLPILPSELLFVLFATSLLSLQYYLTHKLTF